MKAVILAAWEWSRLRPFTNTKPKPLIKIFWKSILKHNIENIYKHVVEITIIVKYKKEEIIKEIWESYKWIKINYITQWEEKWTWAAIKWLEKDFDILLLNWDSIFHKKDLEKIIEFNWYWVLVKEVTNPEKYGIFKVDSENNVREIIEKPSEYVWNLANLWVYKFNSKIIDLANNIEKSSRWEYEITDAINQYVKYHPLKAIPIKKEFIDVWYPWDILSANKYFLSNIKKDKIKWIIEEGVMIKWNIILEEWSIIKSGTYIEWNLYVWKNSIIWPNTYIRWETVIWDTCKVWNAVEVKNSSIWDNTNIAHLSYIWDSIIWNNVNIWWWFISANLRHDKSNIKVMVKWNLIDSWLYKLWVIIWDNVKTWIKSYSMPWRIIQNDTYTNPWEIIK